MSSGLSSLWCLSMLLECNHGIVVDGYDCSVHIGRHSARIVLELHAVVQLVCSFVCSPASNVKPIGKPMCPKVWVHCHIVCN